MQLSVEFMARGVCFALCLHLVRAASCLPSLPLAEPPDAAFCQPSQFSKLLGKPSIRYLDGDIQNDTGAK